MSSKNRNIRFYDPPQAKFVSLSIGEEIEGVFMGVIDTQYGPGYKFREGENRFILSGNRAALDRLFSDLAEPLAAEEAGFIGGLVGHYLVVYRGEDATSAGGRAYGTYKLGHDFDRCPKRCKSRLREQDVAPLSHPRSADAPGQTRAKDDDGPVDDTPF